MRFNCNKPLEKRVKFKFLWFPMWINGECRWLEKAMWVEVWKKHSGFLDYEWSWIPINWVDHKKENLILIVPRLSESIESYDQDEYDQWCIAKDMILHKGAEVIYGKLKSDHGE